MSQGQFVLLSYSAFQKLVYRDVGRYDPICFGFGQGFPAIIAYHCPFPVKHLRRLEIMGTLLSDGFSS